MLEYGQKGTTQKSGTEGPKFPEKNHGSHQRERRVKNQEQQRTVPKLESL